MRALAVVSLLLVACGAEAPASEAVERSEAALAVYRVEASASPSSPQPGSMADLAIRVFGSNDVPVSAFDDLHTQKMHVVAVSSDLQDFIHVHPALGADGTLRVAVPINKPQPYRFFFEYDPAGPAGEQTNRATIEPVGAAVVPPGLATMAAFAGGASAAVVTNGTKVELQPVAHGMLMPGMADTVRVVLTNPNGTPVTDLVDWLGMPGHAIVLSEDTSTFIHAHAMRPGSGGHGGHGGHGGGHSSAPAATAAPNVLDVALTLPAAGLYKMFVQVQRGETVITAPFVLRATAM